MSRKSKQAKSRRSYPTELKEQAVQMLSDGHSAVSIADRLGISHANLIYRWKEQFGTNFNETGSKLDIPGVRNLFSALQDGCNSRF